MAPDKGLSSSFGRHVPLDLNKSYPWGKPCDVFPLPKPVEWTEEQIRAHREFMSKFIRRVTPGLVSQDMVGVQPMSEPKSLVFSMRAVYTPVIDRIVMTDGRILNRNTEYTVSDHATTLHEHPTSDIQWLV